MSLFDDLIFEDGIFCQPGFSAGDFEKEYVSIRQKEGRILDDVTVKMLPFINEREWRIRATSATKLADQLRRENVKSFIEIGCGNGWLTNYLQQQLQIPAIGVDVVKEELKQAARISKGKAGFIYGDIFTLPDLKADVFILAACIQYFPDVKRLISKLNGTIHIIDSPFYVPHAVADARQRSLDYFKSKNAPGMEPFYFHHEPLQNAEYLYRPNLIKIFLGGSPFPWIRIRKG